MHQYSMAAKAPVFFIAYETLASPKPVYLFTRKRSSPVVRKAIT